MRRVRIHWSDVLFTNVTNDAYCTMAFCYVDKCELSYICPGHDIKLQPHQVKLYHIGCVGYGLVLAKALTNKQISHMIR